METYVTIHDQDLLLACEAEGRFDELRHTYLFVGPGAVDRVPADVRLIVSREYDDGFEHLPQFYDFTGWHTLVRHGLISEPRCLMLQYDHHLLTDGLTTEARLRDAFDFEYPTAGVVATVSGYYDNWFLQWPGFEDTMRLSTAACGLTLRTAEAEAPFNRWPSTQGTAWDSAFLCDFMTWFRPVFDVAKGHVLAGHVAERMVQAYCLASGRPAGYAEGLFSHGSLDCHGTGDLMRGNHASYSAKSRAFAAYQSS